MEGRLLSETLRRIGTSLTGARLRNPVGPNPDQPPSCRTPASRPIPKNSTGHIARPPKKSYLCLVFLAIFTLATEKNNEKKTDTKKYVETPLMKQYYSIKAVHPDAVLLFRVGDFYETFGEDAIKASGILGITLTRRANGAASYVELAGFPYHAIDTYSNASERDVVWPIPSYEMGLNPKLTQNTGW